MNGRVKKIKEMLEELIINSSNIFIVGHDEPDYDSIGSALGLSVFSKGLNKKTYIIVADSDIDIDPGVKKIIDENKKEYNIISLNEFEKLVDDNSLLITTDVNKKNLVPVKNSLEKFKKIAIIDHHHEDEQTIETEYKYIDEKISSVSEMVAELLNSTKIKYSKDIANYLLAGIILDTKRYMKNTTSKTHDTAEKLIKKGADSDYVNDLFLTEFEDEGKIALLLYSGHNTNFQTYSYSLFKEYNVSFTLNRECPKTVYRKIDIAKAADKMLKFKIDASFVLGYANDNTITVSARSKSDIDVGEVLSHVSGGGNSKNAGAKVENIDILNLEKELMRQLEQGIYIESQRETPKILRKKPID